MAEAKDEIRVNRAPVLTLWAAVAAERPGYDRDAAIILGHAVAGPSATLTSCRPSTPEMAEMLRCTI
ncbi:hypothetical protein QMO56_19010 [Roseomonas sp. E05]|uniref:hypothetical protein n=1 Tax=Roseomonas sp. E05 TaxID=3046310 RepID=UPI0024BA5D61|nr:hypothetical protein [Roseomonas sp. E05]MDJ0390205.1 hypothetical protein [Roseomonas sp. E05]